ncbi:hypothetical protein JNUCC23_01760 [Peribacillus sp. JNUCC 23]|uniref:hypothetical protein n=1 Tax=Peribacillus sp. NPDC096379 TaxID=3364393 RepID=UPI003818EE72
MGKTAMRGMEKETIVELSMKKINIAVLVVSILFHRKGGQNPHLIYRLLDV